MTDSGRQEPVKMAEVARRAGVSSKTVSRVINDAPHVSTKTQTTVLKTIKQLGYQPDNVARVLAQRRRTNAHPARTGNIGCVAFGSYNKFSNHFHNQLLESISAETIERGYHLDFIYTESDLQNRRLYFSKILSQRIDGLILISITDYERIQELKERVEHVVLIDNFFEDILTDSIVIDKVDGAKKAVRHLIGLGHRNIGFIAGWKERFGRVSERYRGYEEVLMESGIMHNGELLAEGFFSAEGGYEAAKKLLSKKKLTAIFAANDMMAVGALRAAHEMKIRVPEELSIVGFDNIEMAAHTIPPLTTTSVPTAEIGKAAVTRLIERVERETMIPLKIIVPTSLVIRSSTSRAKK